MPKRYRLMVIGLVLSSLGCSILVSTLDSIPLRLLIGIVLAAAGTEMFILGKTTKESSDETS